MVTELGTNIVKVKYFIGDGNLSGREYSYYTESNLQVGDVVIVPTSRGTSKAQVSVINVPEFEIEPFKAVVKIIPAGSRVDKDVTKQFETVSETLKNVTPPASLADAVMQSAKEEGVPVKIVDLGFPESIGNFADIMAPMTTDNTAIIRIHPETDPAYAALSTEVIGLCKYAESRIIKSDADVRTATDDLGLIGKLMKSIEDLRARYVKPLNEHVRAINATFRSLTDPIDQANMTTRQKIQAYRSEVERLRKEAEEINRQADEVARRQAAMNGGEFTVDTTPVQAPPEAARIIRTETGTLATRKVRKARVIDFGKLPDVYKLPNMAVLDALARSKPAVPPPAGVEFYEEESLMMRGK